MTAPNYSWTDVVRSRVPYTARAYHCDPATATNELAWLRPCEDAWTIWSDASVEHPPRHIGILARSAQGWTWSLRTASPTPHDLTDRETAMRAMQRSVELALDYLND
jgi:hypothetical protein